MPMTRNRYPHKSNCKVFASQFSSKSVSFGASGGIRIAAITTATNAIGT